VRQPEGEENGVETPRRGPGQDIGGHEGHCLAGTRRRARAIICGVASSAVTLRAQAARCRVQIPVPQAISSTSPPGWKSPTSLAIRLSARSRFP